MFHVLPGNQLDTLIDPLATLLALPVDNPLQPDIILVQHQGMAHWLNMKLADHPSRQISMNLEFPLPIQQMWTLIRQVLGASQVPEQSPYRREVLVWRLHDLLGQPVITDEPAFAEPTRYWQNQSGRQQPLRRFQLAEQLADLYEQYLMYRPDWIDQWEAGQDDHWQAQLWRHLARNNPNHPLALLKRAMEQLDTPAEPLPERLFIFGINSLAPLWLDFLKALSDRAGLDIHLFHLNPSDEYWGETTSEKQAARRRADWVLKGNDAEDLAIDVGNPLIGNLGKQGQAFVSLLSDRADIETSVFVEPPGDTLLTQLQQDLLKLRDGRDQPTDVSDQSLCVRSSHSALREVQGLHDWLLHQFNADKTLTPKDVLVMCPNVEDYAPFVEAVFARRFDDIGEDVPPLPCSIADRNLKDADPTVAAFLDLLTLPDARFQVTQVIGWLRVPAIQQQFGLAQDDLDPLARWLNAACVHWGLDDRHQHQFIQSNAQTSNDSYSWQQGLERLLVGFAWGDTETVLGQRLLLPNVEGSDAQLLGKLAAFVHTLKYLAADLHQPRTASDWQGFLQDRLRLALFATGASFEAAHDDLRDALRELSEHSQQAGFTGTLPLAVVRHALQQMFASPARTGRQFMTGQITVCSMVPMRSVPFKVLAILGLNDGDFPRQRPPLGFDLMANDTPRLGDRSRRGDDRYLFLEALLSARNALYLSYQGRDVNTNTERQPSLVLTELFAYLEGATGWRTGTGINALPLQPFAPENYVSEPVAENRKPENTDPDNTDPANPWPSFDSRWLRLGQPLPNPNNTPVLAEPDWPETLTIEQLVSFAEHPARAFARQRLGLFLGNDDAPELTDAEPFAANHLDRYKLQQGLIDARFDATLPDSTTLTTKERLSGRLPDNPLIDDTLADWQAQADAFSEHLLSLGAAHLVYEPVERVFAISTDQRLTVSANLPRLPGGELLFWRLADAKGKDHLRLWLHHLLANTQSETITMGVFRERKKDEVYAINFAPMTVDTARTELGHWLAFWRRGQCEPLPWHTDIAMEMAKPRERRDYTPADYDKAWYGDGWFSNGLSDDAYMAWFWPEQPEHDPIFEGVTALYAPLFEHRAQETLQVEKE
ncbi:exodeoxyribonuclease V subunit gamma [Saccharospirillum impatiens]|uniref:exodeoxyribonuclease V subunit gamma n=1 Tax=Saccharospirillum impatiens TaxID=169438 RepID=UPI00040B17D7|nr:exodeoxyribonuclease V subunit gamma [Saccharospirillum impatiens]